MEEKKCLLCEIEKKTRWLYESDKIIICDCMTCNIPMVVVRRHTMKLKADELVEITTACKELFGGDYEFRKDQRKIPDHLHWHVVKRGEVEVIENRG